MSTPDKYETAIRSAMTKAVLRIGVQRLKSGEFFGTKQPTDAQRELPLAA